MALPTTKKTKQLSMKKGGSLPTEAASGRMLQRQHTGTQKPGVTSQEQPAEGSGFTWAKGGSGGDNKMFGFTGSRPAQPGRSSH